MAKITKKEPQTYEEFLLLNCKEKLAFIKRKEKEALARHCAKCDRSAEACRCAVPELIEREAKP